MTTQPPAQELPELPKNVQHIMRRIRACEGEEAARIVLAHPNAPEGVSLEAIAAAMATIIPAHKAMLAAAPAIHEGGEHA